ncbi:MAG TPA: alpha-ketoglutarate-dependent dioxygenase AlkB [Rhizomicrobium sp.]|jgi:alkylated DNA repair protein (DNA oxidative demethylase)
MIAVEARIDVAPGVIVWPRWFDPREQVRLACGVFKLVPEAPFYRPRMPRSGKPFSVEQTNFGPLGWYSDERGYRYESMHPLTRRPWPAIPGVLDQVWRALTDCAASPECCLVNLYRGGARMGLHQDLDEEALDAAVLSVSLGDNAVFRIGGASRRAPTQSFVLRSGDVLMFGGAARLAFHGIDRVIENSSTIVPGGGRLNLTLRRVTRLPEIRDARPGG